MSQLKTKTKFIKKFFSVLGPGLVTGAADDDPSGIVTYSQAGAQFGMAQLWTAFFTLPLMVAVQEMSARVGLVTNKGIAKVIKENYSKLVLYIIVFLLLVANTINIGADLGAVADAAKLIVNLPFIFYGLLFFALTLLLEIYIPYRRYSRILKWLTISLFSYFLTGLIVARNWHQILKASFLPSIHLNFAFAVILTGVIGTTISPYMFFWQASQEIEEKDKSFADNHRMPRVTKFYLSNMRLDTFVGMLFSNITTWFIILTTATVLHNKGITDIQTAAQAASAIRPLVHTFAYAGKISEILFAIGIIGTGLLAIPVLAASSSYAVSEIFDWNESLELRFDQAKRFYAVIAIGTAVGFLMNFIGINPIKALVFTAVLNGICAVPMIFMLIRITSNKKIMGKNTSGPLSKTFSWITFAGMFASAALTIFGLFH